jgi:hypothetical protein
MMAGKARLAALGLVALAAGCASTSGSGGSAGVMVGAEVTRFHIGSSIARGEIAIEPLDPAQGGSLEFSRYAAAVERQLTALGWTVASGNRRSEQVALVRVQQGSREVMRRRSGLSIGIGAGSYGGGVGVGGNVAVPVGGGRAGEIVITELAVRLQRRSDGTAIWEGRAQGEAVAGTPAADPGAMIDRLAQALFAGFPGESGRTVRVR